jgi:hypothetical protein
MWRAEDQALLQRLEDEVIVERLFAHHTAGVWGRSVPGARPLPPRAAGLIASARDAGAGDRVALALAGDVVPLVRWLEAGPLSRRPPALLHHLAVYHAAVGRALEDVAPDVAANAWSRALAAWLALGRERAYLDTLQAAVLGSAAPDARIPAGRVVLELVAELGRIALGSARDLAPRGRAALLALSWIGEAAAHAGVPLEDARSAVSDAERKRTAALDAALAVVGEALSDASARGVLAAEGRAILERTLVIWSWAANDEVVEQWVADQIGNIGWELHRARDWDGLRALVEPFRPLALSLAVRIERDPTKIAFSSHCAQVFVFLADVERDAAARRVHAERAVRVCPTHRNGRLVLASLLCDEAQAKLRAMTVFYRRDELGQVDELVARAEKLYPQLRELPEIKAAASRARGTR